LKTDILIIGGGLSGLVATWQLRSAGINASVLEARSRFGGRILTTAENEANCDLGPSWFWPGQPLVAGLLKRFNLSSYEQFAVGSVLFQHPDGHVENNGGTSPMAGMCRIKGGISQLTNAIANEIDASHRFLEHEVTALSIGKNRDENNITVDVMTPSGRIQVETKRVALAIPPRLVEDLTFSPVLPTKVRITLADTPTWMAGHAKFFAVYDKAFWREQGLCGTAISQYGPLSEIHDASPNSGNVFSLFGFSGLSAVNRASVGREAFIKQALAQLVSLFGDDANQPKAVYFQDWSSEKFTANTADLNAPNHHPEYGLKFRLGSEWGGKLDFISSETSFGNGGLIEGALEAGFAFSERVTGQKTMADANYMPHATNIGGD